MEKEKQSFVLYESVYEALRGLEQDIELRLFHAICDYSLYGVEPDLQGLEKAFFLQVKTGIDNAKERYRRRVENGRAGGRPKNQTKPKETEENQTKPKETEENLNENENDDVDVNDSTTTPLKRGGGGTVIDETEKIKRAIEAQNYRLDASCVNDIAQAIAEKKLDASYVPYCIEALVKRAVDGKGATFTAATFSEKQKMFVAILRSDEFAKSFLELKKISASTKFASSTSIPPPRACEVCKKTLTKRWARPYCEHCQQIYEITADGWAHYFQPSKLSVSLPLRQ